MKKLEINDVKKYVESNIGSFHSIRLQKLEKLKLPVILKKKNPYLFKAKNILTAHDLVKTLLDAYLSSQEETIFGNFLEGLAIFINKKVYKGRKSGITGIDLEFDLNNTRYIVSIKSGPNWGNDSQIKKMIDNFNTARKTLKTTGSKINVTAINGCCYGRTMPRYQYKPKGDYYKFCGQQFWELISGNENLYIDIIEPLGHKAKDKTEEFVKSYSQIINKFTQEFSEDFCEDGIINWGKLVAFNSSKKK